MSRERRLSTPRIYRASTEIKLQNKYIYVCIIYNIVYIYIQYICIYGRMWGQGVLTGSKKDRGN